MVVWLYIALALIFVETMLIRHAVDDLQQQINMLRHRLLECNSRVLQQCLNAKLFDSTTPEEKVTK